MRLADCAVTRAGLRSCPLWAALVSLALLVAAPRAARAQAAPADDDDAPSVSYLWDGGALPFFWGALAAGYALDAWVSPPSTPRLFSASEGGRAKASWELPAWTLQVGGAAAAVTIAVVGDGSRWDHAKGLLEAMSTSALIASALKVTFGRHRPDWTPEGTDANERKSFPSGHATVAFAVATYAILYLDAHVFDATHASGTAVTWSKRLTYTAIGAAATAVAVERTANARHFASDVIAGAAIGAATSTLMFLYQERRHRARGRERAGRAPSLAPSVTGAGVGVAIFGMF